MKIKTAIFRSKLSLLFFILAIFAGFGLVGIESIIAAGNCTFDVYANGKSNPTTPQTWTVQNEAECNNNCPGGLGLNVNCKYTETTSATKASAGYCVYTVTIGGEVQTTQTPGFSSQDQCTQYCSDSGGTRTNCIYAADSTTAGQQEAKQFQAAYVPEKNNEDVCPGFNPLSFKSWLNCFLLNVLRFIVFLLSAAATLFNWIIEPNSLTAVMSNPIIYEIWALVRDTLNIAFILVLLFSAFATIFQVEKFSWKNILLTLVIMALLVNFSFPIARFIIDFSNVLMYYFLNGLNFGGPTYSIFAQNAGNSGLAKILASQSMSSDSSSLIAAVIFGFIFAVTLVMIAVLLVIRTVALAILIIFSSLAFVGSIVPFLSKYATQWWDNLFRYSFFGPIMIFMLYVASRMMEAIQKQKGVFDKLAGDQSVDPGIVSAMAFYAIPIVILWMGIGIAQSMSIAGAGVVVGRGKKFMGWAGKNLGGARPIASWGFKKTGIPGGYKAKLQEFKKRGFFGTDRQAEREAWVSEKAPGFFLGKNKGAIAEQNRKKIQQIREDWKKQGGLPQEELEKKLYDENSAIAQASALELSDKYILKGDNAYKNYCRARENMKGDTSLEKSLNDNVKKKQLDLILSYDINNPTDGKTSENIAKEKLADLQNDDFKNINFKNFFENSKIAKDATKNYFDNISPPRKAEISKRLSAENETLLEDMMAQKEEKQERPIGF